MLIYRTPPPAAPPLSALSRRGDITSTAQISGVFDDFTVSALLTSTALNQRRYRQMSSHVARASCYREVGAWRKG